MEFVNYRTLFGTQNLGRAKLKLLHTGSVPYPYCIKWTMRKMRYQLKVSKLSLISGLIGLNSLFNVTHILQ